MYGSERGARGNSRPYRDRREFIATFGAAVLGSPIASLAQRLSQRTPKIGLLLPSSSTSARFSLAAFREGLQALGYQEGQNLVIEYRWAEGRMDRLPALATELVEQKVEVIVAGGFVAAQAAKNATLEIPIVAAGVADLVESGLVSNLARPDGNLTGFIAAAPETAAKRLQLIKEISPPARHIAVLRNPYANELEWKVIQRAQLDLGFTFTLYDANNVEELDGIFIAISKEHPDFMFILNGPFVFTYRKNISDAAAQAKLPAIYGFREFVDDGGLISYGPSISDSYRRAATYVDKILKGAKISDLPVQEPTKFELVINLRAANMLSLTLSSSLLARADELTE